MNHLVCSRNFLFLIHQENFLNEKIDSQSSVFPTNAATFEGFVLDKLLKTILVYFLLTLQLTFLQYFLNNIYQFFDYLYHHMQILFYQKSIRH